MNNLRPLFILFLILCTVLSYSQTVSSPNDSGAGSLRQAIADAAPGATISIASNLSEINIDSELEISKELNIRKENGSRVKLNIAFKGRIMDIQNATVSFYNINFANGNTIDGGCLRLDNSIANIENCRFENSVASGTMGRGGAIFLRNGSQANIADCVFENNWSNSTGGAIAHDSGSSAGLNITNTKFINNRAGVSPSGAEPGSGGAIFIYGSPVINISSCQFTDNKAASEGGAIWNSSGTINITRSNFSLNKIEGLNTNRGGAALYNNSGTLNIEKSAIYQNTATGNTNYGGGISQGNSGSISLLSSTIAKNSASTLGGGIYGAGGSIQVNACTISENTASTGGGASMLSGLQIKNSIFYNNTAPSSANLSGTIQSNGYNIIGNPQGFSMNIEGGDKLDTNPLLLSFQDNGGVTQSYALQANSPAYNAGDPADTFTDQIDQPVFGGRRDIGAFESQEVLSSNKELYAGNFKVYPNPAKSFLNVEANFSGEVIRATIYNNHGSIVMKKRLDSRSMLDVSGLNPGVYIISIQSGNRLSSYRFTKL